VRLRLPRVELALAAQGSLLTAHRHLPLARTHPTRFWPQWTAHIESMNITTLENKRVRVSATAAAVSSPELTSASGANCSTASFDLAGVSDTTIGTDLQKAMHLRNASRACVLLAHQVLHAYVWQQVCVCVCVAPVCACVWRIMWRR
jgi:hypothetical protein